MGENTVRTIAMDGKEHAGAIEGLSRRFADTSLQVPKVWFAVEKPLIPVTPL